MGTAPLARHQLRATSEYFLPPLACAISPITPSTGRSSGSSSLKSRRRGPSGSRLSLYFPATPQTPTPGVSTLSSTDLHLAWDSDCLTDQGPPLNSLVLRWSCTVLRTQATPPGGPPYR
jgi:hypothetical protein